MNTDFIPVRTPAATTVVNGVPIRRTRAKGKGLNWMWFAADCVPFDVRWLDIEDEVWLEQTAYFLDDSWKAAIRTLIGDRNMTEWLKEREEN